MRRPASGTMVGRVIVVRSVGLPPDQRRGIEAAGIEPCRLPRLVAVVPLLDTAGPASIPIGNNPPASTGRQIEFEAPPSVAALRMFQHAAPAPHGGQRRLKATVIVTKYQP